MRDIQKDLVERLTDEYKIVQDKIDKIGGFRFQVKGWAITIVVGALVAGTATNVVPPPFWLLGILLTLGFFFALEKEQSDLSAKLGQRAINIERTVSRLLDHNDIKVELLFLQFVPGIALHLKRHGQSAKAARVPVLKYLRRLPWIGDYFQQRRKSKLLAEAVRKRRTTHKSHKSIWRAYKEAHVEYYLLQALMATALVTWQINKNIVPPLPKVAPFQNQPRAVEPRPTGITKAPKTRTRSRATNANLSKNRKKTQQ